MPAAHVRWTASTRTDQGPRRHMADAAHHFGRLAWAVADGIGDDYEPAEAATMAAQTAPYAALTGGAAHGIATARTVLLVARARTGRLRGSETTDPTITVTNLGDQGVESVFGVITRRRWRWSASAESSSARSRPAVC
jgi:hypothetical protein